MGFLTRVFAPEQKAVSHKVVRNTLFSALQNVLVFPIPFLLIPFILGRVGIGEYGVYAVFMTVIGFTSLTDLGMFGTLTKHVAEHYAKGDFVALKRLLDTGLMFYIAISLIMMAGLWVCTGHLLPALFRNISTPYPQLRTLWLVMILTMGINFLGAPFSSVVMGLQRMDLSSALGFVSVVSNAILTVAFLSLGWHLRGLLYANLVAAMLSLALVAGSAYRLLPQVPINPFRFDRRVMKEIFSFSWRLYTTQIASVVQSQIEKVYLAWLLGVVPVGWYQIANSAGLKARRLPELLLSPLMAAASELDARGHGEELKELYYRAHKYMAFLSVPTAVAAAVFCRPFVNLWLGPQLSVVAIPLALLVLTNIVIVLTGPGVLISIGQGKLAPAVNSAVSATVLNLVMSFVLIRYYGFPGAVVGTLVSATIGMSIFVYLFHRYTGFPYRRLLTESYLKSLGASLAGSAACLLIRFRRPIGWGGLLLELAVFGVVYFVALILMRFFDAFDLKQAARLLPMFGPKVGVLSEH
ncbi:MAG: oligosaccharide flippase family protein [Terriglobia bacterium]